MNVIIAGGSGLIGKALARFLIERGDEVWILSRRQNPTGIPAGAKTVLWDGHSPRGWEEQVERADAMVNLAGESIGARPWSPERRQQILNSRLDAGSAVTAAVAQAKHKPGVLLQASAVGIYGPLQEEIATETSPLGQDFLARVATQWEESTREVEALGVRRVVTRSAIVLTRDGGILSNFELPVKLFVGGPLGSGRQWLPWIHIADEVGAMRFLLAKETASGVYNLCAPDVVRQGEFTRGLARTLHRPYWMPAPAFALRAVLGQMSTLVLDGQHQVPQRLLETGFAFRYPKLEDALAELYRTSG